MKEVDPEMGAATLEAETAWQERATLPPIVVHHAEPDCLYAKFWHLSLKTKLDITSALEACRKSSLHSQRNGVRGG